MAGIEVRWAIALLVLLGVGPANAFLFRGGPAAGSGSETALLLARTIDVGATALNGTGPAFVIAAQPFDPCEFPSGQKVTAKVGAVDVPITFGALKYHHGGACDGGLDWGQFIADLSGVTASANTQATLTFYKSTGSFSTTTSRTNSDWSGLNITIDLASVTTTSTGANDMDKAGTYTCAFDGGATNTIESYMQGPQGLYRSVTADCVNTGSTHAYLRGRCEFVATQKQDTSLGPVAYRCGIENLLALKANAASAVNPGQFTYTATLKKNGVTVRSEAGVPHIAMTRVPLVKPDGRWDWSVSDPDLALLADYTKIRPTKKMVPFENGITYTGSTPSTAVTNVNTSTGVFTVGTVNNLMGPYHRAVSVEVRATSLPAGVPGGTVYWAVYLSGTTFQLYDTLANALTAGATGKVIPSTTGTSVVLLPAVGATNSFAYNQSMSDAGSRPDISYYSEWGAAYYVGNTRDYQRQARVAAHALSGAPWAVKDHVNNVIPSLLPAAQTPAGMQYYLVGGQPTTFWGIGSSSSNINGGSGATGGNNGWTVDPQHTPGSSAYAVWLMEGGTILRDIILEYANWPVGMYGYAPCRNQTFQGNTYYGVAQWISTGITVRVGANNWRGLNIARFVAGEGSAVETYFTQMLQNDGNLFNAFKTWAGTNFANMGALYMTAGDCPIDTNATRSGNTEGFMLSYMVAYGGLAAGLNGDAVSQVQDVADFVAKWPINLYTTAFPDYFATAYSLTTNTTDQGAGAPPAYVSAATGIGIGGGSNTSFAFTNSSATITHSGGAAPWTLAINDKYRPQNYFNLETAGPENSAPSSHTDGSDYTIIAVNNVARTFATGTTSNATRSGVGGWFLPTGQTNPSSGTLSGDEGNADGFLAYQKAGPAIMCAFGIGGSGSCSAYTAAQARWTGNFNTQAAWGAGNAL